LERDEKATEGRSGCAEAGVGRHHLGNPYGRSGLGEPRRFDAVTIGFHWTTAALIAGMFVSAWLHAMAEGGRLASLLLAIHRSLGLSIWVVAICRLGWRLRFACLPPFPPTMSKAKQALAKSSEYSLYALLLIQPMTGLAQSLTRGRPFLLFGWQAPVVMARDAGLTGLLGSIHRLSAWALLGLVGLHALAALHHRFVLRDEVLQSMLPWKPTKRRARASRGASRIPVRSWPRGWKA
jgi:superoxide oxidase